MGSWYGLWTTRGGMIRDTHIAQNLRIPPMCRWRHLHQHILPVLIRGRGLRVQNKGYSKQTFDPFNELIPSVRLEGVFDTVARCHYVLGKGGVVREGRAEGKGGRKG